MKKYQNIIWGIGIIVIILAGLVWFFSGRQQSGVTNLNPTNGNLTAEESAYDFGAISMAAGKVSHTFKIKNIGPEPLTITKIYTSCMCTEANFLKGNIRKGPFGMPGMDYVPAINETLTSSEEAEVQIIFDPAAHGPAGLGNIQRTISLENNGKSQLNLSISAEVTP